MAVVEPFLISPFFLQYILPFLLVFTLIFAILEKTQLLGEDKKQINSLISILIGLFLIAFPYARDIVVLLMPFLAISSVILFVFMLLYGFIVGKTDGDILGKWWKIAFGAILFVGLLYFILIISGFDGVVWDFMFGSKRGGQLMVNGLLIVIIAGAVIAVIKGGS